MRAYDFLVTEAVKASDIRRGQSGVKIGFEFEILIPADSVTAGGPQYDPNDSSWMNGKTVEDMITKATQNNLSGWRDPVTDNFRIKPTKKAQVGGTGVIWDAYTAWGTKQVADANENLEQRTKDVLEAVKSAFEELKGLVTSGEVKASDIRSTIKMFKDKCEQGSDGVDIARLFTRRETPKLDIWQIKKIKHAAHDCWIHNTNPIDSIWYKIKIADDYNSRYFGGMSGTGQLASTNFVRWIRETFGTTEIKELLKNWWTLRTSTTRPKETVLRKIWYLVTPDAIETTNRGGSYTTEMTDWLKDELEGLFGKVEVFRRYHERSKSLDRWYIEPDGSLQPNRGDYAAEVVGPPLDIKNALAALRKFVVWARSQGIYTNSSTGLHINVSIPGQIDPLKLALFSGDEYALNTFGRINSNYARSVIQKLRSSSAGVLRTEIVNKNTKLELSRLAKSMTGDHFSSVNVTPSGYVSFRHAGGDYLNKLDSVLIVLQNFVRAMVIASDANLAKEEYIKKLQRLVPGTDKQNVPSNIGDTLKSDGIPILTYQVVEFKPMNREELIHGVIKNLRKFMAENMFYVDVRQDNRWAKTWPTNETILRQETIDQIASISPDKFYTVTLIPKTYKAVEQIEREPYGHVFAVWKNGTPPSPLRYADRNGVAKVDRTTLTPDSPLFAKVYHSITTPRLAGPRGVLPKE